MKQFETEQEKFWAGDFGDSYSQRNSDKKIIAGNVHLFSEIIQKTEKVFSVIEFGANIGLNLCALKTLMPHASLSGVEINQYAANKLADLIGPGGEVFNESLLNFKPARKYHLSFVKGVLIHVNPEYLKQAYSVLYESSERYVCLVEYYNPAPLEVQYRGQSGVLFKRDFAGEMMEMYSDLKLLDYGFRYKRDPVFPMDDVTWFLLEKR